MLLGGEGITMLLLKQNVKHSPDLADRTYGLDDDGGTLQEQKEGSG